MNITTKNFPLSNFYPQNEFKFGQDKLSISGLTNVIFDLNNIVFSENNLSLYKIEAEYGDGVTERYDVIVNPFTNSKPFTSISHVYNIEEEENVDGKITFYYKNNLYYEISFEILSIPVNLIDMNLKLNQTISDKNTNFEGNIVTSMFFVDGDNDFYVNSIGVEKVNLTPLTLSVELSGFPLVTSVDRIPITATDLDDIFTIFATKEIFTV